MITSIIICTILVGFISIMYIYQNLKEKWLKKGYKHGQADLVASMIDKATWFSGSNFTAFNVLYLFALKQRKYGHFSADKFRESILKFDHTKRITDLPTEELKQIIES